MPSVISDSNGREYTTYATNAYNLSKTVYCAKNKQTVFICAVKPNYQRKCRLNCEINNITSAINYLCENRQKCFDARDYNMCLYDLRFANIKYQCHDTEQGE